MIRESVLALIGLVVEVVILSALYGVLWAALSLAGLDAGRVSLSLPQVLVTVTVMAVCGVFISCGEYPAQRIAGLMLLGKVAICMIGSWLFYINAVSGPLYAVVSLLPVLGVADVVWAIVAVDTRGGKYV